MILRDNRSPRGRDVGPASGRNQTGRNLGSVATELGKAMPRHPRCGIEGCERRLTNCHMHRPDAVRSVPRHGEGE